MGGSGSPQRIGKYIVDSVLGQGGMGVVFKAHDNYRRVAIKMMLTTLSSNPKLMERFHREAQLTALLEHQNIVTVYDWGEQDGAPYLVMQYLEGTSLDACRFDVPPTMALLKKLRIVSQVCAGLHYAHGQKMEVAGKVFNGIVHRDIKPANIFVLTEANETVKLLDFGIAHLGLDGDGAERPMTRTGQLIGSLVYMSPEQANGARLDSRTDIFSLGVVLYELVAGVRPFEGHDTMSTITRILTAPPPPIEHYLPDCPPELIELIQRALEKSPRDRYQTAEEMAFDLSLIETQLRRQLAKEQLELAESAMERSDWVKALEILIELLKLDGEHVRGLSMHREVQRILRRQHRVEAAARLKAKATEKLEKRQFKDALRLAEEAIGLDDSNYDLIVFRDDIRDSLQRSERSRLAAERAENNLRSDRLPAAASSLDEAFQLDPGNTQALNLKPKVAEALAEQTRRAQFQSFLKNAEESFAERRYQSALDFLAEARLLKPDATELDTLTRRAVQGQEQERRKQELQALGEEVTALLVAGSIDQAEEKLSAAKRSYPSEPLLLEQERALAQWRREEAVRLALGHAETGLQEQRLEDAQAALNEALALDPANPSAQQLGSRISAAIAERAKQAQLELLLQQARESLSQQRFADALEHLRAAEGVDVNVPEIAGLVEQALQGQEQERQRQEQERRRQELKSLGEETGALLAAGHLELAGEKLLAAMRSYPDEPSLLELERARLQLRREEAVRIALERAEISLREERLEDAQAALNEVLSLDPANPNAQQVDSRISAALAEQARRAQLQFLLQQTRESLSHQRYGDALNHLRAAEGLDGHTAEVAALIEQAEQGQEQERRRQDLQARGKEIGALLAAGSIDQAGEKLSAAIRSYPDEPSLLELERTLWQLRREEGVRLALERAETSLEQQRLEDAQAALDEALLLDPDNSNAQQVGTRISAAFAERARRAQLQLLVQQARESLSQQRYGDALDQLRAAEGLDANVPEVAELIEQAEQGQEQESRRQRLKSLGEEVGALLAAGSFDQAGQKLSAAMQSYPDEPSLEELERSLSGLRREEAVHLALGRAESALGQQRLEDAQAALDEALVLDATHSTAQQLAARISAATAERAKQAQLQFLLQQARESLSQQRYGDALDHLRTAGLLESNVPEVEELIEQAVQGEELERRRQELKSLGEEAATLLAAGSLDQAEEKLSAAMRGYPGEPSLEELERNLSQLRRKEAGRLALKRAETHLKEQRLEDAQAALDEALSLDPANPGAIPLQPRIERARFKRSQATSLMDKASTEMEKRRYASALDLLKQAQSLDANIAGLDGLVQRALEGQAKEKRQHTIDSLDEEIRELIAAENFTVAKTRMNAALRQFAEEQQLLDLDQILQQKQSAAELRRAKLKRDHEIFNIFNGVRKLIADGKLAAAQSKLTTAQKRFPDEPALLELSRELSAKREQQQPTIMLTVAEPPPANAGSREAPSQISDHDPSAIETTLTQELASSLLTSLDAKVGGQHEPEVKFEPHIAGPQVAPAGYLTQWHDAVPPPPAAELEPKPAKHFTVYADDWTPFHVATEGGAPAAAEPPPPLESIAPVAATAAGELPLEALSVVRSVPADAQASPAQPARVPYRVPEIPAHTPPARPWLAWGAAAVVVLIGIVYGVAHRFLSPAKTEPAITRFPINFVSDPVGAKIQVKGSTQSSDCVTPLCAMSLPSGSYQVKATLSGYEESDRTLEVQAGLAPVQIQLKPIGLVAPGAAASALLVQTPGVQDASVFVDGKEFKASGSEVSISGDLHKTYQIQVKKDGYEPSASEPFTLARSTEKLVVRLKELPNAATLILAQSTPNADVLIDDKSAGRMSSSGRFRTTVPPGPHKIQLSLDGRASDPGSRQFDPRARVTLSLNVPPPPIVQKAAVAPAKVETTPAPAVVPPPPPDVAKTTWESIKDTTDPGTLTRFGNQHPEYADRVRELVAALDQKMWDQVKDSGDERRLKAYLAAFPGGKYVSNARDAIDAGHKNAEDTGIRQALDRFNQAVNAMNMDQLHGAWLGMSPEQAKRYKQLFANSSKLESRLSVNATSIKVTGDTAEVDCQQTIGVTIAGHKDSSTGPLKVRLRRTENGWAVDQIH